jgi:hypothetical protein
MGKERTEIDFSPFLFNEGLPAGPGRNALPVMFKPL